MPGYSYVSCIIRKLHHMIEIYTGAEFTVAFGHLNKNRPCTSDYSHQPGVLIVITILSHICSMKPCTKVSTGPIISTDNLDKKAIHIMALLLSLCAL